MQHAVLYSLGPTAGAITFNSMSIVPFGLDVVLNNKFAPPQDMDILAAVVGAATLTAARIQTPLLLQTASLHLRPFNTAVLGGNNLNVAEFFDNPVRVRQTEGIDVQVSDSAIDTIRAIIILGDKNYSKITGPRIKARATSSTTVTAGAWTHCPLVFDENLPFRTMRIVGMEVQSATGVLGRLSIPGAPWNPGVPCIQAIGSRIDYHLYGQFAGVLGQFSNQAIPSLDIFCTAADTSAQVFLDLIPA